MSGPVESVGGAAGPSARVLLYTAHDIPVAMTS